LHIGVRAGRREAVGKNDLNRLLLVLRAFLIDRLTGKIKMKKPKKKRKKKKRREHKPCHN
jgi:hypothetical protein